MINNKLNNNQSISISNKYMERKLEAQLAGRYNAAGFDILERYSFMFPRFHRNS